VSAILSGDKGGKNGSKTTVGGIRHKEPSMCFQGALGRHVVDRFTINGDIFPGLLSLADWLGAALWIGNSPGTSVCYKTMAENFKVYYKDADIVIEKVMHAPRVYSANLMDNEGLSDEVLSFIPLMFRIILYFIMLNCIMPSSVYCTCCRIT
jgi:hypothetical protein